MRSSLVFALVAVAGCVAPVRFLAPQPPTFAGLDPIGLTVTDVNGDGKQDLLIVSTWSGGEVRLMLGNGDGTFQQGATLLACKPPARPLVADLNGDGKPDLAIAHAVGGGMVSLLFNNGDGTFGAPVNLPAGGEPQSVRTGDVNGDGRIDLVLVDLPTGAAIAGNVTVLLARGNGLFEAARSQSLMGRPVSVSVGEWSGDGRLDVAVVVQSDTSTTLRLLYGRGDGSFDEARRYDLPFGGAVVLPGVDLNHDGRADLVIGHTTGFTVFLHDGLGGFIRGDSYYLEPSFGMAMADFDLDGNPDVATVHRLFLGDGKGGFTLTGAVAYPYAGGSVGSGDLNGDGSPDLLVLDEAHNQLRVEVNMNRPARASLSRR